MTKKDVILRIISVDEKNGEMTIEINGNREINIAIPLDKKGNPFTGKPLKRSIVQSIYPILKDRIARDANDFSEIKKLEGSSMNVTEIYEDIDETLRDAEKEAIS